MAKIEQGSQRKINYGLRRFVAGAALATVVAPFAAMAPNQLKTDDPDDVTPHKIGYTQVHEGDNPTEIAKRFANGDEDIRKLALEIMDGADKNGLIHPGDMVPINTSLIDASHMDELSFPKEAK